MLSLQVFLFGVPRIERDGETIFVRRRKVMALLAYLAVTSQPHSRDALATLFWPEYDQSSARGNLRRDLSRLKRALGDGVLLVDRMQVTMNPKVALWLDVATFQMNLAKVRQHEHPSSQLCPDCNMALTEAVRLYSDDFMAGFTLPDSPEFDEWQFFQAESLRNSLAGALQQLIHWHVGQEEYEQGIEHGRRWLGLDPLHEPAQRQLMRLYAWSGQQAAALRQYQECVRLLDEELTVEPEEETKALYEAIKARQLEMPAREQGSRGAGEIVAQGHLLPAERYVQQELLMVSGQGEVYRGLDRVSNEPVVIKRLRPDLVARRPELVARLVREGEALSQLNHPNIVRMLAVLETDEDYAIVMEYVAGGSLRQLLDEESQLPQAQALDIALELADALSRAHHLNIIHRDLKPDNVLLAADGTPRLTDFGMARLGGDEVRLTQTGSFIGSPAYMSPEALHGEELDVRSDIWSFGVLLYEMLAGRRPFAGTHITSVLVSILNDPVPELQQFRPDVPLPLINLLQRMLVKERQGRIASMRQVAAELEAIRAGKQGSGGAGERRGGGAEEHVIRSPNRNLPSQPTPFIGREQELADITDTLANAGTRLMTIVGPGGIGKTRLALAIAERIEHIFSDGARFVSLAPLQSAEHLISALANSLEFQFGGSGEPKAQLLRYLSRKHLLLVLDNFEHLLEGAELLMEIVATAAEVKILTTSRERLNLSGEMVYTLGGMIYPDWQRAMDTDATAYSAVQLLLQRAGLVRPDLQPEGHDLVYATRVCQLVQGMPLALVLAAGWLEILSLAEIADEIAQSLDFLETEMRDVPERQRSMRAVFESSWKRLAPQEQRGLAALSVFRGGFRREAAQTVAGAGLPTLRRLANKSLISLNKDGRYEIHELLRQYVAMQLQSGISDQEQAQSRHCAYYASFLQQRTEQLKRARQKEAIEEITADLDNVRAAWHWAIAHKDIEAVEKAAESLYYFSDIQGAFHEGDALFDQAVVALAAEETVLDDASGDTAVVAKQESLVGFLMVFQGWMHSERGRFGKAQKLIEQGLSLIRQAGERSATLPVGDQRYREAFALMHLGWVLFEQEESSEAKQRAQAALPLFSEVGDRWGELLCLLLLATIIEQDGDLATAEQYAQACLTICREIGERREQAIALMVVARNALAWGEYRKAKDYLQPAIQISRELNDSTSKVKALRDRGRLAIVQGEYRQAVATLQECLAILNEVGSTWLLGSVQSYLGTALWLQGDFDGANRCYQDSLVVSRRSGQQTEVASCLSSWGCLAYSRGEYHQAEKYQQESLAIWRQVGNEPEIASCQRYLGYIATAESEQQWSLARQYFSQALQLALKHRLAPLALDVFAGVAEVVAPAGESPLAVELLALAEDHPASTHETRERARLRFGQLSAAMPISDAQTARARGEALDWREAAGSLVTQLAHTGQELRSMVAPESRVGHNLPAQTTPFIGREEEVADVVNKLVEPDTRLLTLAGPGGIGKTRLSIQAATALAVHHTHHFAAGVYFVPLAPLTEAEEIVSALANVLDISLYAEQSEPRQQLLNYLQPQKVLLILDNFEHLLEPASLALINDILTKAPGVKLLATSRERLNLQGERVLLLAGLDTPEAEEVTWSRYSALHLFRESARRARPDFELGSENLAAVIRICRLVQGMPLGIVLAAAWLELLTPAEIVTEIEQSFDFLESEWHDLPARQRSLRAVFNTSWKLLDEVEQAALSALTVFQGGFTRAAAQAVAAASSKTLLRLVHKSWLEREANGRFQIHELLRQYAAEKLATDESRKTQIRDQHAAYFATQLQKWYGKMKGPDSAEAFVAVAADIANVQAAWRWLAAHRHFDTIVQQMLPGFFRYCEVRFEAFLLLPLIEMTRDTLVKNESERQKHLAVLSTVQAAFNLSGGSIRLELFEIILPMYKEALAQAWMVASERGLLPEMGVWGVVLAWVYGWSSNLEDGLAALTELLPHIRGQGDRWELAFALQRLGHLRYKGLGWENAGQNLLEALHLFQETGDEHEIGLTQRLLGILRLMQQRFAEAKLHLQAAQTRLENVGDLVVAAEINWHLADVHFRLGEFDEAFRYLRALRQTHLNLGRTEAATRMLSRESYEALRYSTIDRARETRRQTLTLVQEIDDPLGEAWYTWEMGEIHRVAGEEEDARRWYDKAKGLFERVPDDNGVAFYHRGLGDLAHARGDYQEAQRQFKLSLELAQQMRHSWAESYAAAGMGRALLASGQPDAAWELLLLALKVAKHTADPGITLLALARIAEWCVATGKNEQAVVLTALVVNHYASWHETKAQAEAVSTAATAHLPGEQVAAARERGRELDLETVVSDLL